MNQEVDGYPVISKQAGVENRSGWLVNDIRKAYQGRIRALAYTEKSLTFMNMNTSGLSGESKEKFDCLTEELRSYKKLALAFSGGTDSGFLLAAASVAGLEKVLAVTIVSRFFTEKEKERAGELAGAMGVDHLFVDLDILNCPEVMRNDDRRCYFCKQQGFSRIRDEAANQGILNLVHAINLDDLGDYRPGIEAANELGFKSPLVTAGFSKREIRECSKVLGLSTWDLPSQSCLATRIPAGEAITSQKLEMIEKAEAVLHDLGHAQVRVRCHGGLARIEIPPDDIPAVMDSGVREEISKALKAIGFSFVSLDLTGYRTGKMNQNRT
ncbi:MAG: ATP-dependent sacrificial sulfur transferase LarE [Desulfobacterales bacterium]|nr:ATP-dependent sacrificial sulfur transferase LarE [Desulfobacterales bacterium]